MDVLSVLGAFGYVRHIRRSPRMAGKKLLCKQTGVDFFSGLALAPLALLFLAAFSESVMQALLTSSRITLAGASIIALLAILEEPEHQPPA